MLLFAICSISCQVLSWESPASWFGLHNKCIFLCNEHGMLRAVPFGYQMHPQFFILHLCSASNVQQKWDWGCDLTLKKSLEFPRPTPRSTCSDIFHRRKRLSTGLSFIIFWQRFCELDTFCFGSVIDLFPISKCSIPELCFDFSGGKKVWLLKENTFCNFRKVNILTGAAEGCIGLFQEFFIWLCCLILSFWKCLINTLSWANLTIDN